MDVPTSVMGTGEYTQTVTISTTDAAGNSYSTTATVEVDTLIGVDGSAGGGADGVINAAEFGGGVVLSGSVTGNDSVVVTIDGQTYDAVVTYNETTNTGTWSLAVPTSVMGQGEYSQQVMVTTTDEAGNSDSASMTVNVDTLIGVDAAGAGGADSVINAAEYGSGVMLNGTVTGNDAVSVMIGGQSFDAVVSYDDVTNTGTWTLGVPTSVMGGGEYAQNVMVTTTDAAGNSASTSMTVQVDTLIGVDASSDTGGGDDGVINGVEFGSGVALSGTVTGNGSVDVTIGNQTFPARVTYNEVTNEGTWTLAVPTSVMGQGEYTQDGILVTTTDAAGNSASDTVSVQVDTYVNELTTTATVSGDDLVNNAEAAEGLTLQGTVEEGSRVTITYEYPGGRIVEDADVDADGNWTITYDAADIPQGDYTANITIDATDQYGNVDQITDTFRVDTVAPEAPGIENVVLDEDGVEAIKITATDHDVSVTELTASGGSNELFSVDDEGDLNRAGTKLEYEFDSPLPNGSHLVVNETDTSDNSNATYVVMEESGTNVVDTGGLGDFDIGSIDLSFATQSELTLDLSTLEGLSDNDNNLIIHGGDGDHVTINGASDAQSSTTIDGRNYDVYTMGDDAQIFIEEGVHVHGTI